MSCRASATFDLRELLKPEPLDLRPPRPFVHHRVDFSKPSPMGFALCAACGEHVNKEQWAGRQCPAVGLNREAIFAPVSPTEVACAFCHVPVAVAPEHREMVRFFGTLCSGCALGVAA